MQLYSDCLAFFTYVVRRGYFSQPPIQYVSRYRSHNTIRVLVRMNCGHWQNLLQYSWQLNSFCKIKTAVTRSDGSYISWFLSNRSSEIFEVILYLEHALHQIVWLLLSLFELLICDIIQSVYYNSCHNILGSIGSVKSISKRILARSMQGKQVVTYWCKHSLALVYTLVNFKTWKWENNKNQRRNAIIHHFITYIKQNKWAARVKTPWNEPLTVCQSWSI